MSTTTRQDEDFASELIDSVVISKSALENAINWIGSNLDPDTVFEEQKLLDFARGYLPDDVFNEKELRDWAESNGYTKE